MNAQQPSDYNESHRVAQLQRVAAGAQLPQGQQISPQELGALKGGSVVQANSRPDYWAFAIHAVHGYHQQRAELVAVLKQAASNPSWAEHDKRVKTCADAIAVIDEQIAKLWSRPQ